MEAILLILVFHFLLTTNYTCLTTHVDSVKYIITEKPPSDKMITVTRRLIEEGMRKRYLRGDVKVVTHRELVEGAECPTKYLMEAVENDQVLKPDYQWSEWAWLFTIKRWIDDAPQEISETLTKELKELKVRWRHSFVRNTIMYIWNN